MGVCFKFKFTFSTSSLILLPPLLLRPTMSSTLPRNSRPTQVAAALANSLADLACPPTPPHALEWLFAYPNASPLLYALATALPPRALLTPNEAAALRERPPSQASARAATAAAPALRDEPIRGAQSAAVEALSERVARLRTLRDSLKPLVEQAEKSARDRPVFDIHTDSDTSGRALSSTVRSKEVRDALVPPAAVVPKPAAPSVSAALSVEKRCLYAALARGAESRKTASASAKADAEAAEQVLEKLGPLFEKAGARRRNPEDGVAESERAYKYVQKQLVARSKHRHSAAVDATANALSAVADLRVRLDVLARSLAVRRSNIQSVTKAANEALEATPETELPHNSFRVIAEEILEQESTERAEEAYGDALTKIYALWDSTVDSKDDAPSVSVENAELVALVGSLSARLGEAVVRAPVAASECAERPLGNVEKAVMKNGGALDALLRERRSGAAKRVRSSAVVHRDSQQSARAQGSAAARHAAILELHTVVGSERRNRYGYRDSVEGIDRSDRSLRSSRSLRSPLSLRPSRSTRG